MPLTRIDQNGSLPIFVDEAHVVLMSQAMDQKSGQPLLGQTQLVLNGGGAGVMNMTVKTPVEQVFAAFRQTREIARRDAISASGRIPAGVEA